jgi:SAM-dependent methyltransferase
VKTLLEIFYDTKISSLKVDTYFENYEDLLSKYRNTQPTVVEVGVLLGGSLHMWKEYFGKGCRVIGIDSNPEAIKHRKDGIEIFILNQEKMNEWDQFFSTVGTIDILIDDGGHTSLGQIVTTIAAAKHIKNGGIIVIEDTHSSYAKDFGNPSKYSFDNWVNQISADMNSVYLNKEYKLKRSQNKLIEKLSHIQKYRSLIALHIKSINSLPKGISNISSSENIVDFRYEHYSKSFKILRKLAIFRPINIVSVGNRRPYLLFMNIFINFITLKIANHLYSVVIIFVKFVYNLSVKKHNRKSKIYFR